jgi:hypothetical protein
LVYYPFDVAGQLELSPQLQSYWCELCLAIITDDTGVTLAL